MLRLKALNRNPKMIRNRKKKKADPPSCHCNKQNILTSEHNVSSSRGEKKDLWVGIRLYAMGCNKFREKWQRGINPCRGFHLGMRSAG